MSSFPGSPKLLSGALVAVDPVTHATSVVAFQYNPHTLTRQLQSRGADAGPGAFDLTGPPTETISVELELDAADDLASGDTNALSAGVLPRLAAIERLLSPATDDVRDALALMDQGAIEILPAQGPIILFVWGARRILPVSLRQASVTEEAFDPALNPIRARVSLSMKVLTWQDFPSGHPGHALFLAHQAAMDTLAALVTSSGLDAVLGGASLRL